MTTTNRATHRPVHRTPHRAVATAPPPDRLRRWITALALTVLVVLIVLVIGGYALHWRWTGLSSSVTLWDWLQVFALPIAVASVPLLLTQRRRLSQTHYLAIGVGLAVFAALVLAGYLVPMTWTGFSGNTLWDWLELMLLPLVIATTSLWPAPTQMRRQHFTVGAVGCLVFAVLVFSGYLVPLTWTGFRGNTAWDWVRLLLVPALVPTVVAPFVADRLRERLGGAERNERNDHNAG